MTRPGPRPNCVTLASGRHWRLIYCDPDTRVLAGWTRYRPTDDVARALLAPRGIAAQVVAQLMSGDYVLAQLASALGGLRALGHSRRVLAVEVRQPRADVRRIRRGRV